jgi:signal transduction histidine kinase
MWRGIQRLADSPEALGNIIFGRSQQRIVADVEMADQVRWQTMFVTCAAVTLALPVLWIFDVLNLGFDVLRLGLHMGVALVAGAAAVGFYRGLGKEKMARVVCVMFYVLLLLFSASDGLFHSSVHFWALGNTVLAAFTGGGWFAAIAAGGYAAALGTLSWLWPELGVTAGTRLFINFAADFAGAVIILLYFSGIFERGRRRQMGMIKAQNEELLKAQASVVQNARVIALGEMAGNIAHEISNPLAVIRGRAEQLGRMMKMPKDESTDERQGKIVENIITTADRIQRIVNGLRTYGRLDTGLGRRAMHLEEVVREIVELCRDRALKKRVSVEVRINAESWVTADAVQIGQIVMNLLNNAIDALGESSERQVWLVSEVAEDKVTLNVVDSGAGVPEDIQDKIFQPYFSTKPSGVGTGLGLPMSLGIARSHGGDLVYARRDGRSCFVLTLPKAAPPSWGGGAGSDQGGT